MNEKIDGIRVGSRCVYDGELYEVWEKNRKRGEVRLFDEWTKMSLWVSADDISVVDGDEEFELRMSRYARRKREVLKDNLSVAVKQIDFILRPSKMGQASESERESLVALREVITSYIDGMDI